MMDRQFRLRSISLATIFTITCCCYECHGVPTRSGGRFSCSQLKCTGETTVICHARLGTGAAWLRARMRCRCRREVRVSDVKSSCDVISCNLFQSVFAFFPAEHLKEKQLFRWKPKKLQRIVFAHVENEFDRGTGSYEKSS